MKKKVHLDVAIITLKHCRAVRIRVNIFRSLFMIKKLML